MSDLIKQIRAAINDDERAVVRRMFDMQEDTDSVRGPGWHEAECCRCDWTTTGYERVAEDAAYEHVIQSHRDDRELRLLAAHREIVDECAELLRLADESRARGDRPGIFMAYHVPATTLLGALKKIARAYGIEVES